VSRVRFDSRATPHALQLLYAHDSVTPDAALLPALAARAGNVSGDMLFIPPSSFSRLFTAIERDYVALALRPQAYNEGTNDNDDISSSAIRQLKRTTSRQKRFGFEMVLFSMNFSVIVMPVVTCLFAILRFIVIFVDLLTPCGWQVDVFYFGLCIGFSLPLIM
jgi:hypothetical protein